ncbi:MAG: DUF559 domain-containing protein [Chloroflexota bacterium]
MGNIYDVISDCKSYLGTRVSDFIPYVGYFIDQTTNELCESEIEKFFFAAWITVLEVKRFSVFHGIHGLTPYSCYYVFDGKDVNGEYLLDNFLEHGFYKEMIRMPLAPKRMDLIFPQAYIEPYRVDFVLFRRRAFMDDGQFQEVISKVVIECDGHAYHERTKEQAQRDRSRDRDLQSKGYHVFRFTGSELFNEPIKCALEVDTFFEKQFLRQI